MKNKIAIIVMLVSSPAVAKTKVSRKVAQGKEDQERICEKAVRAMNCGSPEDYRWFITCIDLRAEELPSRCQDYAKEVMDRANHQD